MIQKIKNNRFILAYSFIALLIVFSPYMKPDLIIGSDYPFHLARIDSLKASILDGVFPVKVHSYLCYTYGYGVGFFYPNLFLYIPALFRIIGLSLEVSFKLFSIFLFTSIFLSMFYSTYRLTSSKYAALISATILLFSNQVLGSFYYSFTLGTSIGFIFLPLAIVGMYLFIVEDKTPWMLIFGFTGLIFSHVLSTILAVSVCFIIIICNIKHLFRVDKIKKLFTSILITSSLTISFWLPMLEQFFVQQYHVSVPWTHVDENIIPFVNLFRNTYGLGIVLTALIIIMIIGIIDKGFVDTKILTFLIIGTLFWILPSLSKFWMFTRNLFKFLQFPTRLWGVAIFLLLFSFSVWFDINFKSNNLKKKITCILLVACTYFGFYYLGDQVNNTEDFGNRIIYEEIAGLGAGEEWLPLETTRDFLNTPTSAVSNDGTTIEGIKNKGTFEFIPDPDKIYYDIPFVWYKGYTAKTADNIALDVTKNPDTGMVRVHINNEISATENKSIVVKYSGTKLQYISYFISIISFILVLCYWINQLFYYKKSNKHFF